MSDISADLLRRMNNDLIGAFALSTSQLTNPHRPMTATSLLASLWELQRMPALEPLRITFTTNASEQSTERLFPASRHRSARIRKKLIKRFGGEYRYVPAMWKVGNVVYAHPIFRKEIELRFNVGAFK